MFVQVSTEQALKQQSNDIIRFSVFKNIILELKTSLYVRYVESYAIFYISYVSGGHLGFWKGQAGGKWPPTWNLVFGMVSFRKKQWNDC